MEKNQSFPPSLKVDVRKVFNDKNPKLARLIPGFIYSYLKRIIHEDEINDFLARNGDKYGVDFARAVIKEFNVTVEVNGEENFPVNRRCIFASNHPLGGFDGIILMDLMSKHYKDFRFLSNDILMNIANLVPLFLPVNKHGRQAVDSAGLLHEAYLSDTQIVTFPAGLVSRKINNKVMDLDWKKNFITKSIHYHRDIVPIHCTGRNSDFFYRLANIRKKTGIKSNIEMLYLVDETVKHRNDHIVVTIGETIPYTTFDKTKTPLQWSKFVKNRVYSLAGVTDVPI